MKTHLIWEEARSGHKSPPANEVAVSSDASYVCAPYSFIDDHYLLSGDSSTGSALDPINHNTAE